LTNETGAINEKSSKLSLMSISIMHCLSVSLFGKYSQTCLSDHLSIMTVLAFSLQWSL